MELGADWLRQPPLETPTVNTEKPHVVELTDIPPVEPNESEEIFVSTPDVFVVYRANPFTQVDFVGWVLLNMQGCCAIHGGGPNDEAIFNHRFASAGVMPITMQEVVNSPWIREYSQYAHREGNARVVPLVDARHFVFALKEGTIDCLARGYTCHGPYESAHAALHAAIDGSKGAKE